jgi:hypothetical protein
VDIAIQASHTRYAWGIREIIIYKLNCDPSCLTCDGPSDFDCLTCRYPNEISINGDCVCDIDSGTGYYNDSDTNTLPAVSCVLSCGSKFRDKLTRSCISPCVTPLDFHYTDPADATLTSCVDTCPNNFYKHYDSPTAGGKTCVADCWDATVTDNTTNHYNWDGIDRVCYNDCPVGTYGDPVSHDCVTQCPKTSTTNQDGYFALG